MTARTPKADPRLQLEPASTRSRVAWFLLSVVLPVAIVAVALLLGTGDGDAVRRSADGMPTIAAIGTGSVILFALPLWWFLDRGMRRHRLGVDAGGIEVATTFYRRRLSLDELELDKARVVDLAERTEFRPAFKTNAAALPGFRSGWFRLHNGRKALVATASGQRVLWIPTRAGYDLLLQPRQPQALLDHLRAMAGDGDRR